jgi:hypothetical protein
MIEIRDALEAQAQAVRSMPDVSDVRRRARVRRRRRGVVRATCTLVVLALGAGAVVALREGGDGGARTITTTSKEATVALVFDGGQAQVATSSLRRGLERVDSDAEQGPWTVIVRRPDGSLGRHGAVVTYPAPAAVLERTVDVNGVVGGIADKLVVWPLGDGFARVRGDLDDATMLAIARATTVVDGHPVVGSLRGVDLEVIRSAPYRATSVREMRYGSADLGEGAALGKGLAYTDVFVGGGFEDQLYLQGTLDFVDVDGRATVVSEVGGGNATMAWEPEPGVVALVGYSGSAISAAATDALARLVVRTRPLDATAWSATVVQVVEQPNGFGG